MTRIIKISALALAAATLLAGAANAGGLERGGYNIDLLFDTSRFGGEASGTYVMPNRKLDNVVDVNAANGLGSNGIGGGEANGVGSTDGYFVPRIGVRGAIGDHLDCMADYSQPYGADDNPGANWVGANDNIRTVVNSDGYAATCSVKFGVGSGQFRVIGGVSYLEVDGFKDRLVAPAAFAVGNGIGRLGLEGDGMGWRIGAAYEIPEIALRASLMYYSEVKLDDITGVLDLSQVNGQVVPVFGSTALPEVLELKVQSGIAPGWLAFGSAKWVDWSQLDTIPFCVQGLVPAGSCTTNTQITSLDLNYRDGWTVSAGIAHVLTETVSMAGSLTWDRGTSTTSGAQTDSYVFSAGALFSPNENAEFRVGGALGVLTSGSSANSEVTYDFGNDLVSALSASVKVKF